MISLPSCQPRGGVLCWEMYTFMSSHPTSYPVWDISPLPMPCLGRMKGSACIPLRRLCSHVIPPTAGLPNELLQSLESR